MPRKQIIPLEWPMGGLATDPPFNKQPPGTTRDCLNVRPLDQLEKHLRGGQRAGVSKHVPTQLGVTGNPIQGMAQQTSTGAISLTSDVGARFANPANLPTDFGRGVTWHPDGDIVCLWDNDEYISTYNWISGTGFGTRVQQLIVAAGTTTKCLNADRDFAFSPSGAALMLLKSDRISIFPFTKGAGMGSAVELTTATLGDVSGTNGLLSAAWHPDGDRFFIFYFKSNADKDPKIVVYPWNGTAIGAELHSVEITAHGAEDTEASYANLFLNATGTAVGIANTHLDGLTGYQTFTWSYDTTAGFSNERYADNRGMSYATFHPDGHYVFARSGDDLQVFAFDAVTGLDRTILDTIDATTGSGYCFAVSPSGGHIAFGHSTSPYLTVIPWDGAFQTPLSPSDAAAASVAGGIGWSANGQYIGATVEASPYFSAWTFTANEVAPGTRDTRIVAVSAGSVYRSNPAMTSMAVLSGGATAMTPGHRVQAVQAYQRMFFVDGTTSSYVYLNYLDDTVAGWEAALTAGTLPASDIDGTLCCTIIERYRGRIVMAGLPDQPHNWFMSKSGDPLDWDYAPATTSAVQAVAGNNCEAGELGDIVTALAPFNDDVMIMGGQDSLWIMRGDPAAGGAIDNISQNLGIIGSDAWTFDDTGSFYFLSQDGMYRMPAQGGLPEPLSQGKIDKIFSNLDHSVYHAELVYSHVTKGIHIFLELFDLGSTVLTHYFWDQRTNSFWKDTFPALVGPVSTLNYRAADPTQSAVLLGGPDGYIRALDADASDDDGTIIPSRIRFAAITPGSIYASSRIEDILIVTDADSGDVTFKMFSGDTPETAAAAADANASPRLARTVIGGRNTPMRQRISQNTLIPVLEQLVTTDPWAFEGGGLTVSLLGRMHMKRV